MARGDFLQRLFGRKPPVTRLTQAEAEGMALRAAAAHPLHDRLVLRGVWPEGGRTTWWFWTPTIGAGLSVRVDDETGEAVVVASGGR